jgi:hypothetical protein
VLDPSDVTACIVTRGDVDLAPVEASLIGYGDVIVWDNSVRPDWKCAGRYMAAMEAATELIYFQDDDTIVPRETQVSLLSEYDGEGCLAVWGHGENPDGYDDLPLVCGGAIVDRFSAWSGIARYGAVHGLDESFMYEADFVVGALYRKWRHLMLPFEIRDVAYNGKRLADEPWQKQLKLEITERARAIRDSEKVAA